MRYLCLIILSLFLIGCDKPFDPNCVDGYRVMTLDRAFTAFCRSAGSNEGAIYAYDCIEVTGLTANKSIDRLHLNDGGMFFNVRCYDPYATKEITPAMSYIQGLNFVQEN